MSLFDLTPQFEWTAVAADHYDIWVNDLTTGESGIIRNQNVIGTTFMPSESLPDGHSFIWTVRGIASNGTAGPWAAHRRFSTNSALRPTITQPAATVFTTQPTLAWTSVNGATGYDVWVNDLTTGQNGIIRTTVGSDTSLVPTTPLQAEHSYIWTVRGMTDDGAFGEWAEHSRFVVSNQVSLISPVMSLFGLTPQFEWTAVAADHYDIWVNDLTTGQYEVIRDQNVMGTTYTTTTPLPGEHTFIWTVRAVAADGTPGPWAVHRIFSTSTSQMPSLIP